ncbi:MAG: hypothetical protein HOP14_00075 [Acidobacteria bacterium]|nr:hypothetical protein [Acidobacteriota bacterium]
MAVCGVALAGAMVSAQTQDNDVIFPAETEFQLATGEKVMPAGDYRIERIGHSSMFVLYDGRDTDMASPVAIIDATEQTRGPADFGKVLAHFEAHPESGHEETRVLRGWTLDGARWNIQNVVETNGEGTFADLFGN